MGAFEKLSSKMVTGLAYSGYETMMDTVAAISGIPDNNKAYELKGSGSLSYPLDLVNNAKYSEYIRFDFLVPENDVPEKDWEFDFIKNIDNNENALATKGLSKNQISPLNTISGLVENITSEVGSYVSGAAGKISDDINIGFSTGGISSPNVKISTSDRSVFSVFLNMPNSGIVDSYGVGMEGKEFGTIGALLNTDSTKEIIMDKFKQLGEKAAGSSGRDVLQKNQKIADNTFIEAVFTGVNLRTFNFEFSFSPRSENELSYALAIVETFRYYVRPEKEGLYFKYPASFNATFLRSDGKVNESLPKIGKLWCTSFEADYTPDSIWSSFANGASVNFSLKLAFTEDQPQTRGDL